MAGIVYTVAPIPPDPDHTTYVTAGVIRIGIEYRVLDNAELTRNYEGKDLEEIEAATGGQAVEDNGVSLHVEGLRDGHEYLRFDMFEHGPHYHYIEPSGEKQTIVEFDEISMGPMLPWVLERLRTRLPSMLEYAGGKALADSVDVGLVEKALAQVRALAEDAEAKLAEGR